jgi:hypothetical protein
VKNANDTGCWFGAERKSRFCGDTNYRLLITDYWMRGLSSFFIQYFRQAGIYAALRPASSIYFNNTFPDHQGVAEPLKSPKGLRDLLLSFIYPRLKSRGYSYEIQ